MFPGKMKKITERTTWVLIIISIYIVVLFPFPFVSQIFFFNSATRLPNKVGGRNQQVRLEA
jgi:hypothetical protein